MRHMKRTNLELDEKLLAGAEARQGERAALRNYAEFRRRGVV